VREEGFADDEESRRKGSIGIVRNAAIPLCDALRASPLGMSAEREEGFLDFETRRASRKGIRDTKSVLRDADRRVASLRSE
jgi:hypothetical protein